MAVDPRKARAQFSVGQLVHHKLFDYRGVVIDADPNFQGTDQWYDEVARSRPPKDEPWYHVLVDDGDSQTYVAQQNLEPDPVVRPVNHPMIPVLFDVLGDKGYTSSRLLN